MGGRRLTLLDEHVGMVREIVAVALTIGLAGAIFLAVYVFGEFSYSITDETLRMRWRVLRVLPFGTLSIALRNIIEARPYDRRRDLLGGGYIFGNLLVKKGMVLILRRRLFLVRKVYITPGNGDAFVAELNRRVTDSR